MYSNRSYIVSLSPALRDTTRTEEAKAQSERSLKPVKLYALADNLDIDDPRTIPMTKIFKNGASLPDRPRWLTHSTTALQNPGPPQTPRRRVRLRSSAVPGSTEKPAGCVWVFEKQLD